MRSNRYKLAFLVLGTIALLSTVASYMIEDAYKRQIAAALKADNTLKAIELCYSWQKSGAVVTENPLFFLAKYRSHLKNGNMEGAKQSFNKAIELLGK